MRTFLKVSDIKGAICRFNQQRKILMDFFSGLDKLNKQTVCTGQACLLIHGNISKYS